VSSLDKTKNTATAQSKARNSMFRTATSSGVDEGLNDVDEGLNEADDSTTSKLSDSDITRL
jgi:hypothetical protein